MSYTYHGTSELIALPNRTVQTYPSGLVRVERSFICRKGDIEKFRNQIRVNELMPFDTGAPAIDGLYIFPEPQEIVRDDGFVEFRVTAYGRTNTTGSQRLNVIRREFNDLNVALSEVTVQSCSPTFSSLRDFVDPPQLNLEFVWSVKVDIPLIRIINIPKGAILKVSVENPSIVNKNEYLAQFGGFILEKTTGVDPFFFQTAYLYMAPADASLLETRNVERAVIGMTVNTSTNFGAFTEFISTYAYLGVPITGAGSATRFALNGVPV